jgi:hypothetical protein
MSTIGLQITYLCVCGIETTQEHPYLDREGTWIMKCPACEAEGALEYRTDFAWEDVALSPYAAAVEQEEGWAWGEGQEEGGP